MRLHPRGQPASRSACETDLAECAEWISFGSRSSSHDPVALGRWWAEALGWVLVAHTADEFEIRPSPDRVPGLLFVPVPEEKPGKNRLHSDFRPVDQTAEVERLLSLGARRADVGQRDASWVVLADPEGNEFCILSGRVRPDSEEPVT
jgi:Glyoxalase-like domain